VRAHDAPECHTLDDYRERYAIYKSDPLLQAAHAASPWMLVSDDHEVANDYAAEHSSQDDPPELFLARRAAAYQAYYEHLPLPRRLVPFDGRQRHYTSRAFGDLAAVFMLDGRQYRSPQACAPGPLVEPCAELYSDDRTMLGVAQERWLRRALDASTARWNLLGQQTLFAHFDQSGAGPRAYWADGWNGYPAARERLVAALRGKPVQNPVILSGDLHAFLVNDVHADATDYGSAVVATELVTSSISSQAAPQQSFDAWRAENPNVRLARSDHRGYVRLRVGAESLRADLVAVDDATRPDSPTHVLASFDVESGKPGVVR
jgi:alkaline phosphatase D